MRILSQYFKNNYDKLTYAQKIILRGIEDTMFMSGFH